MENKKNLKVLLQLRDMVNQMIDEDFQSDKKPKLLALKVTKVEPIKKEEIPLDIESPLEDKGELSEEAPLLDDAVKAAHEEIAPEVGEEVCPVCGKSPCECDAVEAGPSESDAVLKLKKLLKK